MQSKDIHQALERIIKSKGFTEQSFCDSIISERTYRRYVYQETEIPFDVLEQLTNKLDLDVYQFLFDVSQDIDLNNMDEIKLLDLLITDRFDQANELLNTLSEPFKSSASQFLLPLMISRLQAHQHQKTHALVDKEMKDALHLDALRQLPFITVDHVKLIEHLYDVFNSEEMTKVKHILKSLISKEKLLVNPSDYTMMKCHQLYLQILIDEHAPIENIRNTFLSAIKDTFINGGMMILDELMSLMIEENLHTKDPIINNLLHEFYIPSSFLYHLNDIKEQEEDVLFLKSLSIDEVLKPIYLRNKVLK
jgi:hypothetical protein